ncbi:hypothetical protein NPIL_297681 [Nephila pilipes]|uniref:Uncharacterized protein n=1 Tax=Nephila pilipes TaxID=299642 RepID=A0A8X6M9A4_NEPPI|nr:hypothetical protein NPIL_297681 [Nephila pilipes]
MSSPATKFCEAQEKGLSPSILYFLSDKSFACECQGPLRTKASRNDRKVNDRNPSLARSIFPAPRATVERGGPRKQAASFPHRFASSPSTGFCYLLSFLPSTEDVASKNSTRDDPTRTFNSLQKS